MGTRMASGGKMKLVGTQNWAQHPRGDDASEEENLADTAALRFALAATER